MACGRTGLKGRGFPWGEMVTRYRPTAREQLTALDFAGEEKGASP